MPPWGAVKGFADFRDDQSLTQDQLDLIANWVEGGAPAGDRRNLPDLPPLKPVTNSARAPAGIPVHGTLTLDRPIALTGIRAQAAPDGAGWLDRWRRGVRSHRLRYTLNAAAHRKLSHRPCHGYGENTAYEKNPDGGMQHCKGQGRETD
jgi:hypothetical protein